MHYLDIHTFFAYWILTYKYMFTDDIRFGATSRLTVPRKTSVKSTKPGTIQLNGLVFGPPLIYMAGRETPELNGSL
jgi:hypothetical protein